MIIIKRIDAPKVLKVLIGKYEAIYHGMRVREGGGGKAINSAS